MKKKLKEKLVEKEFLREQSYRYIATIVQVVGMACSSGFATKMHNAVTCGDLTKLDFESPSFLYSAVALFIGTILITLGWYIMYLVDKDKAKLGD